MDTCGFDSIICTINGYEAKSVKVSTPLDYQTAEPGGAGNGGKLPSMKFLKAEKEKLTTLKDSQYETYQNLRNYQNDLKIVCSNVNIILGKKISRQEDSIKIRIFPNPYYV